MKLDTGTELEIRKYLLASLSSEEQEQVEMRLLTDDEYFQQVNLIEDELVEEYLDDVLSMADRKSFEDTFLCAPERKYKLRFFKALRLRAADSASERAYGNKSLREPFWNRLLRLYDVPRPVLAYSLAAALLALAVGTPLVFQRMSSFEKQISGLQAWLRNQETVEIGLRTEIKQQRDQIAGLRGQEGGRQFPSRAQAVTEPWFTLSPGVQRSAGPVALFEIPNGAAVVWLKLDLAENRRELYKAVLLSDGKEILARNNLKAGVTDREISVSFRVPAADLPTGDCEVRLFGANETEPIDIFIFRVARK